ncbi:MAG: hypothetical protein FJW39_01070 [Acidobacteria bacterium]|nr:hypothetical protein [Acidobacteriota bacterium]
MLALVVALQVQVGDVDLFWREFQAAGRDPQQTQVRYYAKASPAWKQYLAAAGHPEYFVQALKMYPRFYASAEPGSRRAAAMTDAIEAALRRFRDLYPSDPVPVTLGMGRASLAGRATAGRVFLSAEMFSRGPETDMTGLTRWHHWALAPPERIVAAAVHEAVHLHQVEVNEPALAVACLREGAADWIAERITGASTKPETAAWCRPRRKEIFRRLAASSPMLYEGWLYSGEMQEGGPPPDMGYWAGSEIVASYYRRAKDKAAAMRDIVEMRDPRKIILESDYRWMLKRRSR